MKNNIRLAAAVLALLAGPAARADEASRVVNPGTPAPECTLHVNYDRNADLPGYRSGPLCLPFMPTNQLIPPGRGPDFYVTEFSDAAIRRRWATCQQDAACRAQALAGARPFISYEPRVVGQGRGSESVLFGLHKACENGRPLRVGYRWAGILCGRRRASPG